MKTILLTSLLTMSSQAFSAYPSTNEIARTNCETTIKSIVHVFQHWISTNKHKELKFESDLSAFLYQDGMLNTANNLDISCVASLTGFNHQKTCTNYKNEIICNFNRFLESDSMTQYKLIHHELAVIAGSENDKNNDYSYYLTEQLDQLFKMPF